MDIYNSTDLSAVAQEINAKEYDFIHLQYDVYTGFCNKHLKRPFYITSHYGNLPNPNLWENPYPVFFMHATDSAGVICLSDRISRTSMRRYGYTGHIAVLRNGVEYEKFAFAPQDNKKAVCIGNIQPRKRRAMLANFAKDKVFIDSVDPNPAVSVSDIDTLSGKIDIFCGFKKRIFPRTAPTSISSHGRGRRSMRDLRSTARSYF